MIKVEASLNLAKTKIENIEERVHENSGLSRIN